MGRNMGKVTDDYIPDMFDSRLTLTFLVSKHLIIKLITNKFLMILVSDVQCVGSFKHHTLSPR